jgi:hypothetical protein
MMAALADFEIIGELFDIIQLTTGWAFGPHIIGDLLAVILALTRCETPRGSAKEFFHVDTSVD